MDLMMSLTGWVRAVCAVAVVVGLCANLARGDVEFKSLVMEGDHLPGLKEGFKVVSVSYVDTSTNGTIALRALATADGTKRDGVETVAGLWVILPGGEPQLIGRSEYKSNPQRTVAWLASSRTIVNDNGMVLMSDSDICRGYMTPESQRNLKNTAIALYRPGAKPKVFAKSFDVRGGVNRVIRMGHFSPVALRDNGEALFISTAKSSGEQDRTGPDQRGGDGGNEDSAETLWYADSNGNTAIVLDINTQDAGRAAKNYATGWGRAAFAEDGSIVVVGEIRESYKEPGARGLFRLRRGKPAEWILRPNEPLGGGVAGWLRQCDSPLQRKSAIVPFYFVQSEESLLKPEDRTTIYDHSSNLGCWTSSGGVRSFAYSKENAPVAANRVPSSALFRVANESHEVVIQQFYKWREGMPKQQVTGEPFSAYIIISANKPARPLLHSESVVAFRNGNKLDLTKKRHRVSVLSLNDLGTALVTARPEHQKDAPVDPVTCMLFRSGKQPDYLLATKSEIFVDGRARTLKEYWVEQRISLLNDDRVLINASFEDGSGGVIIGTLKNP